LEAEGMKNGPGATTRAGPPSLRDAREFVRLTGHDREKGKTLSNEALMRDSRDIDAERRMQPPFRKMRETSVG